LSMRYIHAAQTTFEALALTPKIGVNCGFRRFVLRHVRRWRVEGFENWLIFYRARRDGVEILHVIHGARDLENLLDTGRR
jgi:toxin ParE1/3/4